MALGRLLLPQQLNDVGRVLRAVAVQNLDLGTRELRDERVDVLGAGECRAEEVSGGVGDGVAVVALAPVRLQDDYRPVEELVHQLQWKKEDGEPVVIRKIESPQLGFALLSSLLLPR